MWHGSDVYFYFRFFEFLKAIATALQYMFLLLSFANEKSSAYN